MGEEKRLKEMYAYYHRSERVICISRIILISFVDYFFRRQQSELCLSDGILLFIWFSYTAYTRRSTG